MWIAPAERRSMHRQWAQPAPFCKPLKHACSGLAPTPCHTSVYAYVIHARHGSSGQQLPSRRLAKTARTPGLHSHELQQSRISSEGRRNMAHGTVLFRK